MPVVSGTKVKAVIIKNKTRFPEASGFCYSADYADLFSFVFSGEYNDYGSIENIKLDGGTDAFMGWFKTNLKLGKVKIKSDDYYDNEDGIPDSDYSEVTFPQLIDIMERDRLFYEDNVFFYDKETDTQGYKKIFVNIGFMMFHESIFDKLSNALYSDNDYFNRSFTEENIIKDCQFAIDELIIGDGNDFTEDDLYTIEKEIEDLGVKNGPKFEALREKYSKIVQSVFGSKKYWDSNISSSEPSYNLVRLFKASEGGDSKIFNEYLAYFQDNKRYDVKEVLKDTILIIRIMASLRKPWMAQTGKGSQSFDEGMYLALADGITEVVYENREDLTGYELACVEDFIEHQNGTNFSFKDGTDYICQEFQGDKMLLGNGCWISYDTFQRYFEY